jgi:hypothetical protein
MYHLIDGKKRLKKRKRDEPDYIKQQYNIIDLSSDDEEDYDITKIKMIDIYNKIINTMDEFEKNVNNTSQHADIMCRMLLIESEKPQYKRYGEIRYRETKDLYENIKDCKSDITKMLKKFERIIEETN